MQTYFMFGYYTPSSVKEINEDRTENAVNIIQGNGGKVKSMHALFGEIDLVFVVEFDDNKQAAQTSLRLSRVTGITFKTTPAFSIDDFDRIASE